MSISGVIVNWSDLRGDLEHAEKLESDLPYFAKTALLIRPKAGGLEPLVFNNAQLELHRQLEDQLAKTGKVRAIVLKARQLGISTAIAARFLKKTIQTPGIRTIIIAHTRSASGNLFKMIKRYIDNMPTDIRPSVGTANQQELLFDRVDSGYAVAVATEEGAGRSDTAQLLHGSECAFWANMQEQLSALLQTVPRLPGSEVILESTGNTYGDQFHQLWRAAEAGESEFQPIFLSWALQSEYRETPPEDFKRNAEENRLAELHGLDDAQIYWRRLKIAELRSEDHFKREYPLTPDEAFLAAQFDSFITPDLVMTARKAKDIEPYGPLLIGVDPAGAGADSTAIAWRRGHVITTMECAGWITRIIQDEDPARVSIDVGGLGIGIYERLVEQGYGNVVNAVNFGSKPIEPPPLDETGRPGGGPLNRRAELWGNMKKCLQGRFSIPDSDSLQSDLCCVGYKYDSSGRLVLESKQDLKRRGMPSPDEADAMALCFTEPDGSPFVRKSNFNRTIIYPCGAYA
jgi:hypothetical protein